MEKNFPGKFCSGYRNYLLTIGFMILCCITAMAQSPLQKKVTVSFKEQSLEEALQLLQKKSKINFAFTQADVAPYRIQAAAYSQTPLSGILEALLKNTSLAFSESGGFVVITAAGTAGKEKASPSGLYKGKVTDAQTGEGLPGVTITAISSRKSALSRADGSFVIEATVNDTLLFTFTGYAVVAVPAGPETILNITMAPAAGSMEEVVVLGYGQTQRKIAQTGAIASITTKEIKQSPSANIANALTGRLPGLISVQRSGEPGADIPELYIRGRATLNSNAPLLTIDGVQKESSAIALLDPNEVESITILKDASATALYGVKGANGVIIVKTRRGKEGKPAINTGVQTSVQTPTRVPEYLDSYHFALLANEAYGNDNPGGALIPYSDEALEAYRTGSDPYKYPNVDWLNMMLKPAQMTRADFNISGGSKLVKYFVNVGYTQQNGLYDAEKNDEYDPNLKYRRYNFRSNVDIDFDENFSIGLSLFGSIENKNATRTATTELFNYLLKVPPNEYPVKYPIGNYGGSSRGNPFALLNATGYTQSYNSSLSGMLTATRKLNFITPGLFIKGNYSFDGYFRNNFTRSKQVQTAQYNGTGNINDPVSYTYAGTDEPLSAPSSSFSQNRNIWLDLSLNYDRSFGVHNITGLVLANRTQTVIGGEIPYVQQGLVSRVTYSFRDKYFAEFNAGYNGTDNFAEGKQYGFFPAFSAGWVISKESFLQNSRAVDFLKLRGSYGLTGNDKLTGRRWLFVSEYASGIGYPFGDPLNTIPGIQEGPMANADVTWEKARKLNVGIELKLWNDLLGITADYFREKRNDILITRGTVPSIIGLPPASLPPANMGRIVNRGFETELTHRHRLGAINYFVRTNMSFARNKVLFKDEVSRPYDYLKETGRPIGQLFGLTAIGFFESVEDIQNSPQQFGNVIPGDIKYKDLNGDGVIDANDEGPMGRSIVPEILYGLSGGLSWKNFDCSFLFQGAANYNVVFSHEGAWEFYNGASVMVQHLNRWTPETAAIATYPVLHAGLNNNNHRTSTFFMKDASYIRLKNVEVGYTFRKVRFAKSNLSSVRIYANGLNLFTWDKMKEGSFDPEAPSGKGFFYPQLRVINFGISADF